MTNINNIAGSAEGVSAAANNNIFSEIIVKVGIICPDHLKFNLTKYGRVDLGDGMKLVYVPTDDSILRVYLPDGNWRNVVKNHSVGSRCNWKYITEQVKNIVCSHYNVPDPKNFPTFNDWANDLYEYGFCGSDKRWAMFDEMMEQEQEEIRMDEEWEKMDECVAEFQPFFEDYVQDLRYVADNYGKLRTKCDCFAAKEIMMKIKDLGETLLRALGNITECSLMKEDDGHWLDTSSLEEWYCDECGRLFYDDFMHLSDIEDLIDNLDYMITESDKPLGLDEEDLEYINEGGCYCFDGYPMYLWQDLREFVATYYHYAYCA